MPSQSSSRPSSLARLNPIAHLPSGKWSTGALMRVIVPVALELVLFQEVWYLVLMPPITIVLLVGNLGLVFVLVRPKSWETRILGMMLGGLAAVLAAIAYYLLGDFVRDHVGVLGKIARNGLKIWAASLTDPAGTLADAVRLVDQHMIEIEGVVVVILGVAIIWACGRLDEGCRILWKGRRGGSQSRSILGGPDPACPSR